MSFDIYLFRMRGNDTVRFKREVFEEVFLAHCPRLNLYRADPWFMQIEYPDGGRADIYIQNSSDEADQARRRARTAEEKLALPQFPPGDPAYIECLAFDHFGGDAFFRDLYELVDRTGSVVLTAGMVARIVVTREAVLKEIPEDFFGMENARVVRDAVELEGAIYGD